MNENCPFAWGCEVACAVDQAAVYSTTPDEVLTQACGPLGADIGRATVQGVMAANTEFGGIAAAAEAPPVEMRCGSCAMHIAVGLRAKIAAVTQAQ